MLLLYWGVCRIGDAEVKSMLHPLTFSILFPFYHHRWLLFCSHILSVWLKMVYPALHKKTPISPSLHHLSASDQLQKSLWSVMHGFGNTHESAYKIFIPAFIIDLCIFQIRQKNMVAHGLIVSDAVFTNFCLCNHLVPVSLLKESTAIPCCLSFSIRYRETRDFLQCISSYIASEHKHSASTW